VPTVGLRGFDNRFARVRLLVAIASVLASLSYAAPAYPDPVIAAAGDIACDTGSDFFNGGAGTEGHCRQKRTSDLLVNAGLSAVLTLGDNQYHVGSLSDFKAAFGRSWGRVKPIIHPAVGDHEYSTARARGYFDYFNGRRKQKGPAGARGKGYYSFEIGSWHLIALNSTCERIAKGSAANGCAPGSPQELWLRADLAAHRSSCTLAYWHRPRYSSGFGGSSTASQAFWQALYEGGADVVLNGDSHNYERFAPQSPNGTLDPVRGIRQFTVGTGGSFFTGWSKFKPNSEVQQSNTFGVLALTLYPASYEWRFLPERGKTFTDSGGGACHGRAPASVPAAPNSLPPSAASRCTIRGTGGDDTLVGTSAPDFICGFGGDDTIRGLGGNDVIRGGAGRDRLYGDRGRDALHGGSGGDRLVGGRGRDTLRGESGNDALRARDGARGDRVFGGKGGDRATVDAGDRTRTVERRSSH
jgi:Ca2+-binding RTX toxin-like protein